MTFVLASRLIFKIEAFKKHVLVHRIITPSLGLSFQYILSLEGWLPTSLCIHYMQYMHCILLQK